MRWMHAIGGDSLPAVSYGILPNVKRSFFLPFFEMDAAVVVVLVANNNV